MTTPLNERRIANAIRVLAMDAVQKANSGHPGAPMGMADIADVVWREFLSHNPTNPNWANRDRFVLSNGHGSMLQYALLHLTGYDLSIEDLKSFFSSFLFFFFTAVIPRLRFKRAFSYIANETGQYASQTSCQF